MELDLFKEKNLLLQLLSVSIPILSATILLVDGITYFYLVLALVTISIALILELPDSVVKTLSCVGLAVNLSLMVFYIFLFLYVMIGTALGL
ncbi:hypothetical protein M4S82_07515 [Planococcus sp. MERTA32b]|nr:hypothetical protein [Planococcus sp. MER TA 32b]